VSAEMGESGSLGRLSVPQGWTSAAPQLRLAALEAPMASAAPGNAAGMLSDMPLLGQAPLMAMPGRDTIRGAQAAGRGAAGRQRAAQRSSANRAANHPMIFGITSGALLIAQWPVPSIRCTSVFARPWKTKVSDCGTK
jgi:hypothetical protein